jgi:AcrR family transcriptional regulator
MNSTSSEKRRYELKARAEAQRLTREQIVQATVDLHRELGPARTTVAEIARRAGVQRLTVYNHFPEPAALFGACQARWIQLHPLPDLAAALAHDQPVERFRAALLGYYRWYRETAPMAEWVQRDRAAVSALDELLHRTADARLDQLAHQLATALPADGRPADLMRALVRLALDFWTWRRLNREGLDDPTAATAMTNAVAPRSVSDCVEG